MQLKSIAATGLLLALGACMGTENRGLESVHQPVVKRSDFAIDLATAGGGAALAAGERERLEGWFRSIGLSFGDRVAIDDPSGIQGGRSEVASLLSSRGMALSGVAPVTAGQVAPGTVRVIVSRATASVPGCPDWSRPSAPDFGNHVASNYGCASNAALAAMVADPIDLIQGRDPTTPDSDTSAKAVRTYRAAPATGAQGLNAESSKGK